MAGQVSNETTDMEPLEVFLSRAHLTIGWPVNTLNSENALFAIKSR